MQLNQERKSLLKKSSNGFEAILVLRCKNRTKNHYFLILKLSAWLIFLTCLMLINQFSKNCIGSFVTFQKIWTIYRTLFTIFNFLEKSYYGLQSSIVYLILASNIRVTIVKGDFLKQVRKIIGCNSDHETTLKGSNQFDSN